MPPALAPSPAAAPPLGVGPGLSGAEPRSPLDWAFALADRDLPGLVRAALAEDRVQLAFQPIVTAGPQPRVAFHEGFMRLLDPKGRPLPAAAFIASVEDSALGREIDCAALRLALQTLRTHRELRLSVNLSARSIGDGAWRRILETGLAAKGGPPLGQRLILEVSEASAMALPEVVGRFMEEMRPRGLSFALDDFGHGLVALRHLRGLAFDCVKVDRTLCACADTSEDARVVAGALVLVARQFDMFAVAEGVETPRQADALRKIGFDCLQGYLFGRPRPTI